MKKVWIICFLFMNVVCAYAQKTDTFRVFFALNDPNVSGPEGKFIESLVAKKQLVKEEKLMVLGYADYLGSNGYNDTLSYNRAKNVADRLIQAGLRKEDLKLCVGKGKINRAAVKGKRGFADDRYVQIIVEANQPLLRLKEHEANDTILHITLDMIQVDATYPLNILFENARSTVLKESYPEMQKVYNFMKNFPTVTIRIEGHICCMDPKERTTDGYDLNDGGRLSLNRARVIYNYLIAKGIDKARLSFAGLGNTKPFKTPELSEDDKKSNRRVAIRILSK